MCPTLRSVSPLPLPIFYQAFSLFFTEFYKLLIYTIDPTIHRFQIEEFAPLLKIFCNPQMPTLAFVVVHRWEKI